MQELLSPRFTKRYALTSDDKASGATYTPKVLADFVAARIVEAATSLPSDRPLRILDPAIGHGELLISLVEHLARHQDLNIELYGFETDLTALRTATERLEVAWPDVSVHFQQENFLDFVLEHSGAEQDLFQFASLQPYDLIIANPPYVRTQIMGAKQAQRLAMQFGLAGRVDLYYAFVLAVSQVLGPKGIAGIIVSNRFMTTKSGAPVRKAILERFNLVHAWDLGDTKLFDAAVLPAVLLLEGRSGDAPQQPGFTSIYSTSEPATGEASDPLAALSDDGVFDVGDGRHFRVQRGKLSTSGAPDGVWRIATDAVETWLGAVEKHTWGTWRDIGKIRVGIKTCADKVFIRSDWQEMPEAVRPELLKPLSTHHIARRFKPIEAERPIQVLYPHEIAEGRRRPVDLSRFPRTQAYLEAHRAALEGRRYVIDAGREWYEIWVPQDPAAWARPKLVFRDIAEEPTFWIDLSGSVVNGDCYWLTSQSTGDDDLLWLAAAVGNSTFIEKFYDLRFHNKLYAGRRRFITQYVENFPLPDPRGRLGRAIIDKAKAVYECIPSEVAEQHQAELNAMVWEALTGRTRA